jgi:hypothetical protein
LSWQGKALASGVFYVMSRGKELSRNFVSCDLDFDVNDGKAELQRRKEE